MVEPHRRPVVGAVRDLGPAVVGERRRRRGDVQPERVGRVVHHRVGRVEGPRRWLGHALADARQRAERGVVEEPKPHDAHVARHATLGAVESLAVAVLQARDELLLRRWRRHSRRQRRRTSVLRAQAGVDGALRNESCQRAVLVKAVVRVDGALRGAGHEDAEGRWAHDSAAAVHSFFYDHDEFISCSLSCRRLEYM